MKAARLHQPNQPLKIDDLPKPRPGHSEVLISVEAAGICGTDLHIQDGEFMNVPGVERSSMKLPRVLGHEISGIVVEPGDAVTGFKIGDRVTVSPNVSCGQCEFCLRGEGAICENRYSYGEDVDGGFEEFVAIKKENLFKIPDSISFEEAAIMADALATPFHAMSLLNVSLGDTIAIYGIGGLGMNAVQIGKLRGARILAVDVIEDKLRVAKDLGADVVINAHEENPVERILELTNGKGVDKAFEMVGGQATVEAAIRSVKRGGKVGVVGGSNQEFRVGIRQLLWNDISIYACYGRLEPYITQMLSLVGDGKIDLKRMITNRVKLEDINEGFRILRDKVGNPIRVAVLT